MVDFSTSFIVIKFGYAQQKYDTSKECFYSLMFFSKKHTYKHDGEYKNGVMSVWSNWENSELLKWKSKAGGTL